MTNSSSNGGQTVVSGGKTPWAHIAVLGTVCALVIGVYGWSAQSLFRELRSLSGPLRLDRLRPAGSAITVFLLAAAVTTIP